MSPEDRLTDEQRDQLDELVPHPWPTRWRALVVTSVLLVAVVGPVAAVQTGSLSPRLAHGDGYGSTVHGTRDEPLTATREVPLRNDGRWEVTVEALELPHLDDVTWGEVDGLPLRLEPGEEGEVEVSFVSTGCDIEVDGFDAFPVRASGGLLGPRVIDVPSPHLGDPRQRVTYVGEDGEELTLPSWPDQEPSWILEVINPACTTPPEGW